MERYFKKICKGISSSSSDEPNAHKLLENRPPTEVEVNLNGIDSNQGLRKPIEKFDVANISRSNSRQMDGADRTRLMTMLGVARFLLKQGLSFGRWEESNSPLDKDNFTALLELTNYLRNKDVSKVLGQDALCNDHMPSPRIQEGLAHACALEVTQAMVDDIGDKVFTLLIDVAQDISMEGQIGVVLRYVNKEGCVIERFLAMVNAIDYSSDSLTDAVRVLFARHDLSLSKLRGQGYNVTSNMLDAFKSVILQENPDALYVHCFSYQLHLIIIDVAKGICAVYELFRYIFMIVNTIGAPCKMSDQGIQLEHERLVSELVSGERESGKGRNKEASSAWPKDTHWGSYYLTMHRLCYLWPSVEQVLDNVCDYATYSEDRATAESVMEKMYNYEFVFVLHLMKYLLGITIELSLVLQQKDQNIVQVVSLIRSVKIQLQSFRKDGWEVIVDQVNRFCELNHIPLIDMNESITRRGYKRHGAQCITNFHYFHVEIFYQAVNLTMQEVNNRFSEVSVELFNCIACLDPRNSFSQFNVDKLMRLAAIFPGDFSESDCLCLPSQLNDFILNMRSDPRFSMISNMGSLASKMVKVGKHSVFPLVYRMIELLLVLPVATASVERAFFAMKTAVTDLPNRMGDAWTNDSLVVYIENEIFSSIDNEQILQRFQSMDIGSP